MVKVLIVDNSPTARKMIQTLLETDPEIEVLKALPSAGETIEYLEKKFPKPDILISDINMPGMNGFDLIKHVMAYNPLPILIMTVLNKDANFMRALKLGALDIIEKPAPSAWQELPKVGIELVEKVKTLSKVKVITHLAGRQHKKNVKPPEDAIVPEKSDKVVCIASSTGGPNTLHKLLKNLPKGFPAPIFIVQHMSEGFFTTGLVEWFRESLPNPVEEAEHKKIICPGTIYICPAGRHLLLTEKSMVLYDSPLRKNLRPSADYLFESAAECFGKNTVALILTGIGDDGSDGCRAIYEKGGRVLAQSEDSCIVFGMPGAAIKTGCVHKIIHIDHMARELIHLL